jgi:glycosyltransferase involved in cell wall biosynthesis
MEDHKIRIFIFGCSKRAQAIEESLAYINNIEIIGYVDNDKNKWDSYYLQRKVYSPTEAFSRYKKDESILFVIAPQNFEKIETQLRASGVERIYIHLYELLESLAEVKENYGIEKRNKQVLIISNGGLPKEDNKYRSGFVYRRLLAYKENGIIMDSYGFIRVMGMSKYEYEGNQIYEGDAYGLLHLINNNHYDTIFVHFPTEEVMQYINKYVDDTVKVCIWVHGYEVLKWERRSFNYTKEEIEEKIESLMRSNKEKEDFFRRIFTKDNYRFIFVSNWLKEIVREDMGMLPRYYQVIPNYIDSKLFNYIPKKKCDAAKVLLIKSNKTRMYANDIAAKAIEMLASRMCFAEIEFDIYGDGELFEENYHGLLEKNYPNVHIYRKFLTQIEIADLHKTHGIFLCPTRQDTQGVSMCEAMSSGLVVITNNVAAVPEYINETAGILCDNEDYIGMANALERLFYDRELFLRLSKNAARYVQEKCSYENTVRLELNMIRNL